jgi:hypothetical protein
MASRNAFSVSSNLLTILAQYYLRNPHFTGEDGFCIWFSGTSSLCVVDLSTLNVTEIKGFLPQISDETFGVAMRCVAKDMGNVIIVAFVIENTWSIAYYQTGIEADNHLLEEILPRCNLPYKK